MIKVLVLIVAWILKNLLSSIFFIYGCLKNLIIFDSQYFYNIALSIDFFGNATGKYMMNDLLIKKGGYEFGNPKETISYALAKNWQLNRLTKLGQFIADILNAVDKNHLQKSINNNEK